MINTTTNGKLAKKESFERKNKQDRIKKWFDHFSKLLREESELGDVKEFSVTKVFGNVGIDDDDFNFNEFKLARCSLKEKNNQVLKISQQQFSRDAFLLI